MDDSIRMGELTLGFTAARALDASGHAVIANVLTILPFAARYVTGGARGGDAFIGRWLYENRPFSEHVVIVPANRSQVDPWWEDSAGMRVTLILMPDGTTYDDRNARLVGESGRLCGFPAYLEDDPRSLRSGTWQTLRMARLARMLYRWHCVKPPYASWVASTRRLRTVN